jgi:rubrerythrin
MPLSKEAMREYMRRYRAKQRANWHVDMEEPKEEYPEYQAYEDAFRKPTNLYDNFGEDKKGMVIVCSVCGTPLNRGHCPRCEPQPDD